MLADLPEEGASEIEGPEERLLAAPPAFGGVTEAVEDEQSVQRRVVGTRPTRSRRLQPVQSEAVPAGTGPAVQNVRDKRAELIAFLRSEVPHAVAQLKAMEERLSVGGREACRHASASGRELIQAVADHVLPPTNKVWTDRTGERHELTAGKPINRLVTFVDQQLGSQVKSWELTLLAVQLQAAWRRMSDDGLHRRLAPSQPTTLLETQLAEAYTHICFGLARVAEAARHK